jgi:hypothetical protein
MNVTRTLRRAAVLGATGIVLGVGMLWAAAPAQAMPQSECDYYWDRFIYWDHRWYYESDPTRRQAYRAASDAALEVYYVHDC